MATAEEFLSRYEPKKQQVNAVEQFLTPYEEEKRGLLGNIGADISQRGANIGEEFVRTLSGEKPLTTLPFRYGGQVGGGVYDVLGRVGSAITPDIIEEPLRRVAGDIASYVSQTKPAQMVQEAWQATPTDMQDTLSGAASMSGLAPTGKALGAVERGINVKRTLPTIEEVTNASRELYEKGRQLGADFSPQVLQDVFNKAQQNLPKDALSKKLIDLDEADKFALKIEKEIGEAPTLETFERVDKFLGDKATDSYKDRPSISRKFSDMQIALRESVENPSNVVGDANGIQAHREATRLWGIKKKMEDVARAIKVGSRNEVPSTGIKSQFKRIADNDKLMRGYSAAEKEAIQRAAQTGKLDGVLKTFGSRLNIIAGLATGGKGALIGLGLSGAGRAGAEAVKKGQAGDVMKRLGERTGMVKEERRISPAGILGSLQQ